MVPCGWESEVRKFGIQEIDEGQMNTVEDNEADFDA